MRRGKGAGMSGNENWKRRHAVQIAAQLPEDPKDALRVLELARELVETFLSEADNQPVRARRPLVAVSGAAASL